MKKGNKRVNIYIKLDLQLHVSCSWVMMALYHEFSLGLLAVIFARHHVRITLLPFTCILVFYFSHLPTLSFQSSHARAHASHRREGKRVISHCRECLPRKRMAFNLTEIQTLHIKEIVVEYTLL
jgi:hypothetical protein